MEELKLLMEVALALRTEAFVFHQKNVQGVHIYFFFDSFKFLVGKNEYEIQFLSQNM